MKKFSEKVIVFSIVVTVADLIISSIEMDGNPLSGWDFIFTRIAACFLGLFLIKKTGLWTSTEIHRKKFWHGVLLGTPLIILGIASGIVSNLAQLNESSFLGFANLLLFTISMILVGLAEEIVYRGLLFHNMLEKWGRHPQGLWKSILISAAVFGIAHLPNMLFAPPLTVLVQALNAATAGMLFSAIYVKTNHIGSVIMVHALVDWFALVMQQCFAGTSIIVVELSLRQAAFLIIAGSLPPILFTWLYVGRKGHPVSTPNPL